jgi:hypothetical protein
MTLVPTGNGSSAWECVRHYFDAEEWDTQPVPDGLGLHWAYRGKNGEWYGQTWWIEQADQLLVYSVCPLPMPIEARRGVAELVHLIKSELTHGCFECDVATGQTRFRTGVAVSVGELSESIVGRAVLANVATLDRYLPAFVRVCAGQAPGDAVRQVHVTGGSGSAVG